MHVLDDVDGGIPLFQRGRVHQRRQPAAPRIGGDIGRGDGGVPNTQEILEQQEVPGVPLGESVSHPRPGNTGLQTIDLQCRPQQPRQHVERDVVSVRLAVGGVYRHAAAGRDGDGFADQSALADSRRSPDVDDATGATDGLVEDPGDRIELPGPSNQCRLAATERLTLSDGQQSPGGNRNVRTFDPHHFRIAQHHRGIDQTGGRFAEHHPARRGRRLHPLSHPDLLADGRVTCCGRADFTGDHLTGIQPDPQFHGDPVTTFDVGRQATRFLLDVDGCQASAKSVILQRGGCAEQRHDAVAGELVDRSAVALHHGRRTVQQLGHDLAQPFGT